MTLPSKICSTIPLPFTLKTWLMWILVISIMFLNVQTFFINKIVLRKLKNIISRY